jgi:hypothetical protein
LPDRVSDRNASLSAPEWMTTHARKSARKADPHGLLRVIKIGQADETLVKADFALKAHSAACQ